MRGCERAHFYVTLSVMLTLKVQARFLWVTHNLMMVHTSAKFFQNPSRNDNYKRSKYEKNDPFFWHLTTNDILTLEVLAWFFCMTHRLRVVNCFVKFFSNSINDRYGEDTICDIQTDKDQNLNVCPNHYRGEDMTGNNEK